MDSQPWRPSRRTALGLIGAVAGASALTGGEAAYAAPAGVEIVDDGATGVAPITDPTRSSAMRGLSR